MISALELKVNKQKKPFLINSTKKIFSLNSSAPIHRVTFNHSISCVLLIDKPNESCENSKKKNLKEMSYPPQKKKLLKRKIIILQQQRQKMPQFHKLLQNA